MKKYEVIEDNSGGLTLVVFAEDGEKVEYLHTGYEYIHGQLKDDLQAISDGADPVNEWDGNEENPQEFYDNILSFEYGWEIIADNNGIYHETMGTEARFEFGINKDD